MTKLKIERIGGLAGFGGQNSHIKSTGEIETDDLSEEDRNTVNDLFKSPENQAKTTGADTFRYKISRNTPEGLESIEAGEEKIPDVILQSVKDKLI